VSDVKWQYLLVAAVFIGAVAISLWTATRVDMQDIEHGLTNFSEEEHEGEEHEGLIEGGNVALYGAIVIILFFIALAVFGWSKYH
jgi:1,4-dihydroxy-2-naphthoate octaprenyltransferase